MTADFYPDDNAFKVLSQAIKQSCRTFELFEIARLILEKPERWVCVAKHPGQKESEPAILHASVPDGLPFQSEADAVRHVLTHYLDQFFEVETFEAEPPAGNFQIVHRCGITKALIGPPNFHRYQALLREHQSNRLPNVPFEKVQARLETVREPEVIQEWLESMKQGRRFRLKEAPEGAEAPVFEDFESARLYLLANAREKLVRPAFSVRFLGRDLQLLPPSDALRRSVEVLHEQQLRFPLATANNIRGRLRRLNLAVYKRGSKGVSYVCAVKRRFRSPDEVMADHLNDLIQFLEANANLKAADLPHQYLGLPREAPPSGEAAVEGSTDGAASGDMGESLAALRRDLRYLVTQGYVIEYSDGRLEVPPVKELPKDKKAERKKDAAAASAPPAGEEGSAQETVPGHPAQEAPSGAAVPEAHSLPPERKEAAVPEERKAETPAGEAEKSAPRPEPESSEPEPSEQPEASADAQPEAVPERDAPSEAVPLAGEEEGPVVEPVPSLLEQVDPRPAASPEASEEPARKVEPIVPEAQAQEGATREAEAPAEEAGNETEAKPGAERREES